MSRAVRIIPTFLMLQSDQEQRACGKHSQILREIEMIGVEFTTRCHDTFIFRQTAEFFYV